MKVKLKLARVGMAMEEGTIARWNFNVGDQFSAGDVLYEVETEKVVNEVETPGNGTLLRILVQEGEVAQVGQAVCEIKTE